MIKEQTVLVLGAGASYDFGFPLGERLCEDIYNFVLKQSNGFSNDTHSISKVYNSKLLARLLELAVGLGLANEQDETNESFVKKFAENLFEAQPKSIDEFLKDRPEFSLIGRICIVFCISKYEDKRSKNFSPIKDGGTYTFPNFGWYKYLWDKMTENINSIKEFKKENKITVITFNYDRSLEFYLFRALKSKFNKQDDETAKIFNYIKIKHVYGRLGSFYWGLNNSNRHSALGENEYTAKANDFTPWEPSVLFRIWGNVGTHGMDGRDFEPNRTVLTEEARSQIVHRCIDAANNIKIYSEVHEEEKSHECLEALNYAKRIYFLGFGYHEQNLLALGLENGVLSEDAQIFGTAYGMSDGDMQVIKDRIAQSIGCKTRGDTGPGSEVVRLANKWDGQNDKASIIKEFFRNHPNADLA